MNDSSEKLYMQIFGEEYKPLDKEDVLKIYLKDPFEFSGSTGTRNVRR